MAFVYENIKESETLSVERKLKDGRLSFELPKRNYIYVRILTFRHSLPSSH